MILIQSSQQSQGLLIEFKWNRACKHSTKNVSYRSFISKPNVIFKWSITRQKHCVIQSVKWSYCIFIDQLTFVHDLRWLKSAVKDKTLRQNFFFLLILLDLFTKHATTVPRVARVSSLHCSQQLFPYSSCLSLVLSLTLLVIYTKVPLLSSSLPAVHSILLARYCFPFGWGSLGNDTGKQPLVSVERGCWEATVNDAAPAQIFFFFFTWSSELEVVSTLAWGCHVSVPTLRFLFFFFWRMPLFFFQVKLNYHTFTQPMGLVRF